MTGFNSNINELIEKFKAIKSELTTVDLSDALLAGVNAAKASMQNRIFNKGLDAGETPIGSYAGPKKRAKTGEFDGRNKDFLFGDLDEGVEPKLSEYEKKRVAKGRQIKYKDLEFTGTLRRGIVTVKESSTRVVAAIPNEKLYNIAKYQEEYIQAPIFTLTDKERELMRTNIIAISNQIYDRLFNPKKPV
jgi:hypothetical protein